MKKNVLSFITLSFIAFLSCALLSSCAVKDCQTQHALQNERQDIREDTDSVMGYRPFNLF